jgi:hypothetical protein
VFPSGSFQERPIRRNHDTLNQSKEWKDLKTVAGSGQAVAFGQHYFYFAERSAADAYVKVLPRVRLASEKPDSPDGYPVNIGVSKLTSATIVNQLKAVR